MSSEQWDETFDVVVVGSGAAGLTGALMAVRNGLRPVVLEKGDSWGGTSAWSGGVVWAPGNRPQQQAGIADSAEDAAAYLDEIIPDDGVPMARECRMAFLDNVPKMVDALVEEGVRWAVDTQPDYQDAPHAGARRGLDAEIFDARLLGRWRDTINRPPAPFAVTIREIPCVVRGFSSLGNAVRLARILVRDQMLRRRKQDPLTTGASLVAQLMLAALKRQIDVRLGHKVMRLVQSEGRVTGVVVEAAGETRRIEARQGVMLCSGGFAHADTLRQQHQQMDGRMSCAIAGDTGDFLSSADELDAMTALMEHCWWATALKYPGDVPGFFHWERSMPFGIVVDQSGKRFANESKDYSSFGQSMVDHGVTDAWLIMDARHRQRYVFGGMAPRFTPKWAFDSGMLIKAGTLSELAERCGLDQAALRRTVDRFNGFAQDGVDKDFGRGGSPYEVFWGDPKVKPNPNMGKIEKAPFYAAKFYLTDIGTRGGFVTNVHGQVVDRQLEPIAGLYAAGNSAVAILGRSYPGPGATLGPGMTYALLAATHMARRNRVD